jgi:hypothetical protein
MNQDMGVTQNAILLLGYISGAVTRLDGMYEPVKVDAANGTLILRHRKSGNLHRIAVVQIEGSL